MDGQWGWQGFGGGVFAAASGWDPRKGPFENTDPGGFWLGSWNDHSGWENPLFFDPGEWPPPREKCGWDEQARISPSFPLAAPPHRAPPAAATTAGAEAAWESEPEPRDPFSQLPHDILERIFAHLPLLSVVRARAVCRLWRVITTSVHFRKLAARITTHRPWYLMYKDSEKHASVAFDPTSRKWHSLVLPSLQILPSSSIVASAGGIACFLDKTNSDVAYVCNPMTQTWKRLPNPPGRSSDYCAVAMCAEGEGYKIVVARSTPVTNDYAQWSLSIEVYDSSAGMWKSPRLKLLQGWRPGEESSICGGVFYCVTHSNVGAGQDYPRHGLIAFELASGEFRDEILPMPCSLSCVRLVNCWERLVMVGGIGTYDFIKGVAVWELDREWKQRSRMPTKQFHGFAGGLDDVFSCSGHGDIIFIHSYGSPQLMVFDMAQGSWTWARSCPVLKRDPLHLFTGFCFEPRLDVYVV